MKNVAVAYKIFLKTHHKKAHDAVINLVEQNIIQYTMSVHKMILISSDTQSSDMEIC